MSGTLGTLYVSLEAKLGQFIDGMTKAETVSKAQTRKIEKDFDRLQSKITDFGKKAGIALAAGITGIGAVVKSTNDRLQDLSDMASQLGVSANSLALYSAAIDVAGGNTMGLKLALQNLPRNFSAAQKAAGAMRDDAKALGLNLKQAYTPMQLFAAALEGLEKLPAGTARLGLAQRFFGTTGAMAVIPLVQQGTEATKQMIATLQKLGVGISPQFYNQLNDLDNATHLLHYSFEGLENQLLQALAPAITTVANDFANWVEQASTNGTIDKIADAIKTLISFVFDLATHWKELAVVFGAFEIGKLTIGVVSFTSAISKLGGLLPVLSVGFKSAFSLVPLLLNPITLAALAAAGAIAGIATVVYKYNNQLKPLNDSVTALATANDTLKKAMDEVNKARGDAIPLARQQAFEDIQASKAALTNAQAQLQAAKAHLAAINATRQAEENSHPYGAMAADAKPFVVSGLSNAATAQQKKIDQQAASIAAQQKKIDDAYSKLALTTPDTGAPPSASGTGIGTGTGSALQTAAAAYQALVDKVNELSDSTDTLLGKEEAQIRAIASVGGKAIAAGADQTKVQAEVAAGIDKINAKYQQQLQLQQTQEDQYKQNLQNQVDTQQKQYQFQLQSVNMTQDQIDAQTRLNNVTSTYQQQLTNLQNQLALATNPQDKATIQQHINDTTASYNQQYANTQQYNSNLQAQKESPIAGMKEGMMEFAQTGLDVADQMKSAFNSLFSGLSDAIVQWAETGKLNFKDVLKSFLEMVLKMEIQALAAKVILSFLGVGGVFGGTSSGLANTNLDGSATFNSLTGAGHYYGQAKGGAWFNGIQKFARGSVFANKVVSSPTLFKFAGGTGMMGEAGPEAIMPLTRGKDGKLGVQVSGNSQASGNNTQPVTVNVINNTSSQAQVQESTGQDGSKLINVIIGEVNNQIARGGSTYKTISQTFGLRRQGVPV